MLDIFIILLFIVISLLGIKSYHKSEYNTDNFSFDNCNSIKAICAIVVVFCHLSNHVNDSYLIKALDGLGTFAVTIFLMFSGFGVMKNYIIHQEYSFQLLIKRISRIVKPYFVVLILYVLLYILKGYEINSLIKMDLEAFYTGDTVVSNSWFVFILIFLYILFYLETKLFKEVKHILTFVFIVSIMCLIVMKYFNFCACWYISLLAFSYGCLYAYYQDKYNEIIKQKYMLFYVCNFLILTCLLYLNFEFFPNNSNILFDQLKYLAFLNMLVIITLKFCFGNKILKVIFNISYELYLVHGLVIMIVSYFVNNSLLLCLLSLFLSICAAYLLKTLEKLIYKS